MTSTNLLPKIDKFHKASTAHCATAFEELESVLALIELMKDQMNGLQQRVFERYKQQTIQFAHDMLLAELNHEELKRRLGLDNA